MIRSLFGTCLIATLFTQFSTTDLEGADRAFLGVVLSPVPDALSAHLELESGVLIQDVLPDSPASQAGLKKHDIILEIDKSACKTSKDVTKKLSTMKPDQEIQLKISRGGKTLDLKAKLSRFHEVEAPKKKVVKKKKKGFLGIQFQPIPEILSLHLKIQPGHGVLVTSVLPKSAADKAGLKTNDLILGVQPVGKKTKNKPVKVNNLADRISHMVEGDEVILETIQAGERKDLKVKLSARPESFISSEHFPGIKEITPGFQPQPFGDQGFFFEHPRFKGRLKFFGDDGATIFEFPEMEWQGEDLNEFFEKHFQQFKGSAKDMPESLKNHFEDIKKQLEKATKEAQKHSNGFKFDFNFDSKSKNGKPSKKSHSYQSSRRTMSVIENDFKITVDDVDGKKSVSVQKGKENIAKNLPVEKLDTLPKEIQAKVKKVLKDLDKNVKVKVKTIQPKVEIKTKESKSVKI